MCGIAAELALVGRPSANGLEAVRRMQRAQIHRGPDGTTELRYGPLTLSFARLALVDVANGGQPFVSHDGDVVVVVNGEIYNHHEIRRELAHVRWTSGSDCEAVLHLYEDDPGSVPRRLEGMFAAIVYDRRRQTLTAFCDRFGIKPLFWMRARDRLLLASEVKALNAHPLVTAGIDWPRSLMDPQLLGAPRLYDQPPISFFAGVELLPAATEIVVNARSGLVSSRRYWVPPGSPEASLPASDAASAYEAALRRSVRGCVLQSERDVGVFLSGGVDSGLVAAMAAADRPPLTYSIRTFSTEANGDADGAVRTADALGLVHRELNFDASRVWTPEEYLRVLYVCETPLTGPEQLFKYELHRAVRADNANVRVVISGQGSDEFNGGYTSMLAPAEEGWAGFIATLRLLSELGDVDPIRQTWQDLVGPLLQTERVSSRVAYGSEDVLWDRYVKTKCRDLQMYNNWHEDRTAAAHGSEGRVPFLDHSVVEAALSLEPKQRQQLFWDKAILRTIAGRWLPESVAGAAKVPLFYGSGERHARNLILETMLARDAELVRLAFSDPEAPVKADSMIGALRTARRSAGSNVTWVLLTRLVNLGLLDALARHKIVEPPELDRPLPIRTYVPERSRARRS